MQQVIGPQQRQLFGKGRMPVRWPDRVWDQETFDMANKTLSTDSSLQPSLAHYMARWVRTYSVHMQQNVSALT